MMTPEENLKNAIKCGVKLIYLITQDEMRAERLVASIGKERKLEILSWSLASGMQLCSVTDDGNIVRANAPQIEQESSGSSGRGGFIERNTKTFSGGIEYAFDVVAANNAGKKRQGQGETGSLFVMKDYHMGFGEAKVVSVIKEMISTRLNKTLFSIVVITAVRRIPLELEHFAKIIELDLLSSQAIGSLMTTYADKMRTLSKDMRNNGNPAIDYSPTEVAELSKAALGMTEYDINTMSAELTMIHGLSGKITPAEVIDYKKNCVARNQGLEYYDSPEGMNVVGGLDLLKTWLQQRRNAFSDEAKKFGLPTPKGLLMLGVPGSGKSLICKTVSHEWNLPLIRFDVGRMMGGLVGSSEQNVRQAIKLAERVAPCILWMDEIEKGLSGVKSSSQTDGGTIARVFSTFITWMQDKTAPVFVIATANSIEELPPELLRKGRFDEVFFVDLPNLTEREDIFKIHISKRGRDASKFDIKYLAELADGFSGAEIEESIVSALTAVFARDMGKSDITTTDVVAAIRQIVPLSRMQGEKIAALRLWANERARLASTAG